MSSNLCMPDFKHIPGMIPAFPGSQSDNNNSATFVILLCTNPARTGLLSVTRNINDGMI